MPEVNWDHTPDPHKETTSYRGLLFHATAPFEAYLIDIMRSSLSLFAASGK